MSDIAMRADNLSKLYRIGRAQQRHDTPSIALRTGIGRNRAGKSTLLKILSRITEPTDGRAG